jgi:hypothetical protein
MLSNQARYFVALRQASFLAQSIQPAVGGFMKPRPYFHLLTRDLDEIFNKNYENLQILYALSYELEFREKIHSKYLKQNIENQIQNLQNKDYNLIQKNKNLISKIAELTQIINILTNKINKLTNENNKLSEIIQKFYNKMNYFHSKYST